MQTIKEKFFEEFEITRMSKNSIVVKDKMNRDIFVHRNSFNAIVNDIAVDYRISNLNIGLSEFDTFWLEVLVWKHI